MSSLTLILSGKTSALKANYFPAIQLDPNAEYECCLVDFHTYSIPNINATNNKFYVKTYKNIEIFPKSYDSNDAYNAALKNLLDSNKKWTEESFAKLNWLYHMSDYRNKVVEHASLKYCENEETFTIPVGFYELHDIVDILMGQVGPLQISFDKNTSRVHITIADDNVTVDFTQPNSLASVLGFGNVELGARQLHIGQFPVNISAINVIRIDCNIATRSFINEKHTHTIHEFYPDVDPGYKIIEVPKNLIYLPIVERTIQTVHVDVVDDNGNLVDFQGETITCRIHIRRTAN